MIGLETNIDSVNTAINNVTANNLTQCIQIIHQEPMEIFSKLPDIAQKNNLIHFTMCNPPFYDSDQSTTNYSPNKKWKNRTGNRPPPKTLQTGSTDELSIPGGELSFIQKMVDESIQFRQYVCVFTTMLGHKISMIRVLRYLAEKQITNIAQTQFCQGNTTRWAIAWSFDSRIFLRKVPSYGPQTMCSKKSFSYEIPNSSSDSSLDTELLNLCQQLNKINLTLDMLDQTNKKLYAGKIFAFENTWSHQRKKRRQMQQKECKQLLDADLTMENGKRKSNFNSNDEETCSKRIKNCNDEMKFEYVYLVVEIRLKKNENKICLEMEYLSGTAKIDGAYQLYQYLVNNWAKI